MYKFSRIVAGNFLVHSVNATAGTLHMKKLTDSGSTITQDTVNLYITGRYMLSCNGLKDVALGPGSCSIDGEIIFPVGEIVTEAVVQDGVRLCVSVIAGKWSRRLETNDFTAIDGCLLIPLEGEILVGNKTIKAGQIALVQGDKYVTVHGKVFVAISESSS